MFNLIKGEQGGYLKGKEKDIGFGYWRRKEKGRENFKITRVIRIE